MKVRIVFYFAIFIMLLNIACGKKDATSYTLNDKEAQEQIALFFDAIESEDYAAAEQLLHPENTTSVNELFVALEAGLGIDFQEGIEIETYENISSQFESDTASYAMDAKIIVGEMPACVEFVIVQDVNGFGIYTYTFEF